MYSQDYFNRISRELSVRSEQVKAVAALLAEGATVPFMARYRKEATGSLDEVEIAAIRDRLEQLLELDKRKLAIQKSLEEQNKLSPELEKAVKEAETMALLEDIYLPYRPKRRTKATIAREKGLEPLAVILFKQGPEDPLKEAVDFIDPEKEVPDAVSALMGACDIIAEWLSEDTALRQKLRTHFQKNASIRSRVLPGKAEEGQKFKDYFEWEEPVSKAPSHRVLAIRRGEKEMILSMDMTPEDESSIQIIENHCITTNNSCAEWVKKAVADGYKRLLKPQMETELRLETKQKADEEAIRVFADNLRQLLLASPLGEKRVLAIDPGFRTGCKCAAIDEQGSLLEHFNIYPNEPQLKKAESESMVKKVLKLHKLDAIAIGNGTAGRETETWLRQILWDAVPAIVMVNESGASIYSASEVAREEFPDLDLTVRGAISIGRRLKDPLAELVKIDPKSIGVGQYQHDVDQNKLKLSLDDVVLSCVNGVGVELNMASKPLLSYVSGLGPQLAANIVAYRNANGPFKSREELKKVPRLGDKAFEQCAGFLRITQASNPLDASAVHPERYKLVEQMAKDLQCAVKDLMTSEELRQKIELKKYLSEEVGLPTIQDIIEELAKIGRDPREKFEAFQFAEGVNAPEDLKIGMKLSGLVTNVTNFGAFVDIGVHQDGLVHISHLADKFIKHPSEVVGVAQKVEVTVIEVDIDRKRISLSMKKDPFKPTAQEGNKAIKKETPIVEGDLQSKLNALKGRFK